MKTDNSKTDDSKTDDSKTGQTSPATPDHVTARLRQRLSDPSWSISWLCRPRIDSGRIDSGRIDSGPGDRQAELVGLACSRLGDDLRRRQQVCDRVGRLMLDARDRNVVFVVAAGSAVEPWAIRAAEIYRCGLLSIDLSGMRRPGEAGGMSSPASERKRIKSRRDEELIACCDVVEALYVRRGGAISKALSARLRTRQDACVRVGVTNLPECGAAELIAAGAVGRWLPAPVTARVTSRGGTGWIDTDDAWIRDRTGWLVHCTRACTGAWPGQTERQSADDWLLSSPGPREPLTTLRRILTMRRLVGSAVTSSAGDPVVCFAGVSLRELLRRRCYRPHLRRWDYEPFGIAIRRSVAADSGIVPVVYGSPEEKKKLPADQKFRFQAAGKTYDWTAEKEFRVRGDFDFSGISAGDLRVFVPDADSAAELTAVCPWPICIMDPTMV